MNKLRITKLRLENFKLFDTKTFEFEGKDLIVLDGPNGFGKTSLFDALELLITKNITRINRAAGTLIKSFSYNDPLLLCRDITGGALAGGAFISVTIEVEKEGSKYTLCRRMKCTPRTDGKAYPDNFSEFSLYQLPDFEAEEEEWVLLSPEKEDYLIRSLFGENIQHYYSLFYYIEQEDSTHFLKRNERERKSFIGSLFDTTAQEAQSKKIESVRKRLGSRLKDAEGIVTGLLAKKRESEKWVQQEGPKAEAYQAVLSKLGIAKAWDAEITHLDEAVYQTGKKDLQALEDFLTNFEAFKRDRINARLVRFAEDHAVLRSAVVLLHFLPAVDGILQAYKEQSQLLAARQKLRGDQLKATLLGNRIDFDHICRLLHVDAPPVSLAAKVEQLRTLDEQALELDLLIQELNHSRQELQERFLKVKEREEVQDNECPLCGADWSSLEKLLYAMQEKEVKFTSLYKGNITQINTLCEELVNNELRQVADSLGAYATSHTLIQEAFYLKLVEATKHKNELVTFNNWLEKHAIDITPFLHKEFNSASLASSEEVQALMGFLMGRQQPVDKELIPLNATVIFQEFFEAKEDKLELIRIAELQEKRRYLEYLWYLANHTSLANTAAALEQAQNQQTKLAALDAKLRLLNGDYKTEINLFRSRVIKDIEIPFYLYSARIIQSYQRGLGLFIQGDEGQELKSIKFLSDLNSNHDALFSLSSGQLTALVIAFSLALNKIYAENSLLLIDDPTQTMDEINVASLTELLRNEFSDRQIFLSTHEDHTSIYLRYKFQKYGKATQRINLKETAFPQ